MKSRSKSLSVLLTALTAALSTHAGAFGSPDPFSTELLAPPRPVLATVSGSDFLPCQPLAPNAVYGVLQVVNQALCRNPITHEAWANARVQAAQVGIARSDYLPDLDGRIAATHSRTDGQSTDLRSTSLTLSWLLYDFGARDANLEYARQLLSAASSTLDATVQTVFLTALQSYYNTQAARAAVIAAVESE